MRVLLLTQFFDPEPTLKGMTLARALQRSGHEVEVLTGFPNYPQGRIYDGYRLRAWHRETVDGVRINRVWLYPSHDRSIARRGLNYLSFAACAATLGPWLVNNPDVIYVYHPPPTVAIAAMVLRLVTGAPYIYEIQDMWPDTIASSGMLSNRAILGAIGAWCNWAYRAADRIIVISEGFKRLLVERGVSEQRVEVIRNWCDEDRIVFDNRVVQDKAELGFTGGFNVLFAGNMGPAQGLNSVLEAAALLATRRPSVRFILLGDGVDRLRLEFEASARGLTNVTFLPARPMSEMGGILPLADALLVHLRRNELFSVTIPSKLQAYMYAGVPIIMGVGGEAAEIVERARCGITCASEDPDSIANAVEAMAVMSRADRQAMGEAGRQVYLETMSVAAGGRRYHDILTIVANGRQGGLA